MATETVSQPQTVRQQAAPPSRRFLWVRGVAAIAIAAAAALAAAVLPGSSSSRDRGLAPTHTIQRGDLLVTVTEQGTLESSNNTEIKCRVRGKNNTIISVVESGAEVKPGDELLRLETLLIDEEISERTKFVHLARAEVARSKANVARAEIAILEYTEGTFVAEMAKLQKDLAISKSALLSARNVLNHTKLMANSEYVSELEVEEKEFKVAQADLDVKLTATKIDVLKKFSREEQLATLHGDLKAAEANFDANAERAFADKKRLSRAEEELKHCVITADRSGIVIYPTGKQWEDSPDIEEGATVHKDQVLLLMPDLTKMQVKVGIHESVIDRIHPEMSAKVTLQGKTIEANITSVSSVAMPAGWWTGNVVKYDTIVELPPVNGLKPGMSVEVEVIMARHKDVLMIPTSAVMSTSNGHACWVQHEGNVERVEIEIGDSNDMFIVVESGLAGGEQVVLDPLAYIEQAQAEAAAMLDDNKPRRSQSEPPSFDEGVKRVVDQLLKEERSFVPAQVEAP